MNIEDVQSEETNVENPLHKIFEKQNQLVLKYKDIEKLPDYPLNLDFYEHQVIVKDFKQRGMEEIAEAVEAFQNDDINHFKEELIDALHFFIELNILVGKKAEDFKTFEKFKVHTDRKISDQSLLYQVGVCTVNYGLVMNCLKNKPWKQTELKTDQLKFYELLTKAFNGFVNMLFKVGMSSDEIYNIYFKKHKVNEFRIESNY